MHMLIIFCGFIEYIFILSANQSRHNLFNAPKIIYQQRTYDGAYNDIFTDIYSKSTGKLKTGMVDSHRRKLLLILSEFNLRRLSSSSSCGIQSKTRSRFSIISQLKVTQWLFKKYYSPSCEALMILFSTCFSRPLPIEI